MKQTTHNKRGFTLVEMLIVIVITGIIATVSIANYRQGERQKKVAIAADTVVNSIRNAQNFALTSRQILGSTCAQGKAPASYLIYFSVTSQMELYGIDKCNNFNLIENYTYPPGTRVSNGGYLADDVVVSALQFKFTPPFAKLTLSTNSSGANAGTFSSFTTAQILVQSTDGQINKAVTVDGVAGRIGE